MVAEDREGPGVDDNTGCIWRYTRPFFWRWGVGIADGCTVPRPGCAGAGSRCWSPNRMRLVRLVSFASAFAGHWHWLLCARRLAANDERREVEAVRFVQGALEGRSRAPAWFNLDGRLATAGKSGRAHGGGFNLAGVLFLGLLLESWASGGGRGNGFSFSGSGQTSQESKTPPNEPCHPWPPPGSAAQAWHFPHIIVLCQARPSPDASRLSRASTRLCIRFQMCPSGGRRQSIRKQAGEGTRAVLCRTCTRSLSLSQATQRRESTRHALKVAGLAGLGWWTGAPSRPPAAALLRRRNAVVPVFRDRSCQVGSRASRRSGRACLAIMDAGPSLPRDLHRIEQRIR